MKGILPKTADVLQQISTFDCINDYVLIGGTALALQINHRVSEDIDFCKWKITKTEKPQVNRLGIEKELSQVGFAKRDILDTYHVDYTVKDVKVTFFCNSLYKKPAQLQTTTLINNVRLADINSIGMMKLEAMMFRSKLRDYYDFFSILQAGGNFNLIIDGFLKYTNHDYRTRDVLSLLADAKRIDSERNINHLLPKYQVAQNEISAFLLPYIENYKNLRKGFTVDEMKDELKKAGVKFSALSEVQKLKLLKGKEIDINMATMQLVRNNDGGVSLNIQCQEKNQANKYNIKY